MNSQRYGDIIARLEASGRPDRKLFEDAYVACFGEVDWGKPESYQKFGHFLQLTEIGAWEQAALMFVPEGVTWQVTGRVKDEGYFADVDITHRCDTAATPAIALCIACIKAIASLKSRSTR